MSLSTHVRYVIDENDLIASVDLDCSDSENPSCPIHLSRPDILIGESFWNVVSDRELSSLYRLTLDKVRRQGQSVTVPFRCERSKLPNGETITFAPLPNNRVLATTEPFCEGEKKMCPNSVKEKAKKVDFVYCCSWCRSTRKPSDSWEEAKEVDEAPMTDNGDLAAVTSHGICPDCYEKEVSELKEEQQQQSTGS